MYFSGDPSRKRVTLGGISSKEPDRNAFVQQARLDRDRRDALRKRNSSAIKIQKCFRGRKVVSAERSRKREQFYLKFGNCCQKVDRSCFDTDSEFLRQLLFFFDARNVGDFSILVETCRLLHQFVRVGVFKPQSGFASVDLVNKKYFSGEKLSARDMALWMDSRLLPHLVPWPPELP